ncbi:unnamed protein product [Ectocarpus sp. 4 AP-2014]
MSRGGGGAYSRWGGYVTCVALMGIACLLIVVFLSALLLVVCLLCCSCLRCWHVWSCMTMYLADTCPRQPRNQPRDHNALVFVAVAYGQESAYKTRDDRVSLVVFCTRSLFFCGLGLPNPLSPLVEWVVWLNRDISRTTNGRRSRVL